MIPVFNAVIIFGIFAIFFFMIVLVRDIVGWLKGPPVQKKPNNRLRQRAIDYARGGKDDSIDNDRLRYLTQSEIDKKRR
jgi:hypothetical protein